MISFFTRKDVVATTQTHFGTTCTHQCTRFSFSKTLLASMAVLLLILGGSLNSKAVTKTWVSTTAGGSWATASNWSPSGVPAAGDDIVINCNGSSNMIITISGFVPSTSAFLSLTIGGSGTGDVILSGTTATIAFNRLNVTNDFTLDGVSNSSTSMTGNGAGLLYNRVVAGKTFRVAIDGTTCTFGTAAGCVFTISGTMIIGSGGSMTSTTNSTVVVASGGVIEYSPASGAGPAVGAMTVQAGGLLDLNYTGTTASPQISTSQPVISGRVRIRGTFTGFSTLGSTLSYQSGSILEYNRPSGNPFTATTREWPATNSPTNVTINNAASSVVISMPSSSGSRTITGSLTLTLGSLSVPSSTTLTFDGGATPIVRNGTTETGTITMNSNANLTFQGSGAAATIPNGAFTSSPTTFSNLTVNRTNKLTLNNQDLFPSTLTMTAGIIGLGTGDLQFTTLSGSSFSATKMVVFSATSGYLKRSFSISSFQSQQFPIGDDVGIAQYNGFTFNFGPSSTTRVVGWKVVDGIHPNMNTPSTPANYLSRYYSSEVTPSTGTYSYYVDLPYIASAEDIVGTEAAIGASRWNGSAWVGTEASINTTSDVIRFASTVNETSAPLGFDITGRTLDIDNPCGATTITPGAPGAGCTNVVTGSTSGATQTFSGGSCGTADDDVWFKFTATATSHVVRVTPSSSFDAVMQAYYNANCANITSGSNINSCFDSGGDGAVGDMQLTGLTVGFTYYVRVWEYGTYASPPTVNSFQICVMTPPANDNPCGAVVVTPNAAGSTTCSSPTAGDALLSSQTYSSGSCNFAGTANDVWYRFVATGSSHTIRVTGNGTFDPVIQAYTLSSGTCPSATFTAISGACMDDTGTAGTENLLLSGLTSGTTYYYRIYHASSTVPSNTSFTTCVFTPPANNEFCNGTTVTAVTLTPGSTCSPTAGDAVFASQTYSYGTCDFSYTSAVADVWYRFQATATSHTVQVVGNGTFDPIITAYNAGTTSTCPVTPSAISGACMDNTGAGGIETLQLSSLTVNNWYYVRVYHGSSTVPSNTTFTICILSGAANDEPCNATAVTPNAPGSITCSSPTAGSANLASQTYSYGTCDFSYTGTVRDVWYSFVATSRSHTISVTGSASYDAVVTAYIQSGGTCPSATYSAISGACTDDTGTGGTETLQLSNLTVGTTYYYRVYHGSSSVPATVTFTTCVFTPNTNDEFCNGSTILATTLTPGASCVTTSGDAVYASQTNSYGTCDYSYPSPVRDMWYRFQAGFTGATINVAGNGTYDPVITAYTAGATATCPVSLTAISGACADDNTNFGSTGSNESLQLTGLTIGHWYYVRVYHGASSVPTNTTFTICVVNPPVNDACATATSVSQTASCSPTAGTTVGATGGLNFYTGDDDDVWYSFTATGTAATIEVTGNTGFNAVINFRDNSACNGTAVVYHDYAGVAGTERIRVTGLTAGQTYRYRIFSSGTSSSSQGTFTTCVYNYTPTNNDNVANAIVASVGLTVGTNNISGYGFEVNSNSSSITGLEPDGFEWLDYPYSPKNSQWFQFTPTTSGCYSLASTGFDTQLAIYTASNLSNFNTFSEVASDDDSGTPLYTSLIAGAALNAGMTYYIQVSGYAGSTGTPTLNITGPIVASAPVISDATSISCSGFTANWSASSGSASYVIDVATDAGFTNIVLSNAAAGSGTSYVVSGLPTGTKFYYRMRGVNACGVQSGNSNEIFVDTYPLAISITANTNTLCDGQSFDLNTTGGAGATSYSWTGPNSFSSSSANPAAFSAGLAAAGDYTVTATNACGSVTSDPFTLTVTPKITYYLDVDGDGYSTGASIQACSPPANYYLESELISIAGDCNDNGSSVWRTGDFYVDIDGDGYTVGGLVNICYGTNIPNNYSATSLGEDCSDTNASIWRTGEAYTDSDGDGYTVGGLNTVCYGAELPAGSSFTTLGEDCNDDAENVWRTGNFYFDNDGDGYTFGSITTLCYGLDVPAGYIVSSLGEDCNDSNPNVWRTDLFFIDNDGDTYTVGTGTVLCYGTNPPGGYTLTQSVTPDCNDNSASEWQTGQFYFDGDGDGYSVGSAVTLCYGNTNPPNYLASPLGVDCSDVNASIWRTDLFFLDNDGDTHTVGSGVTLCYGATNPSGYTLIQNGNDCDDNNNTIWQTGVLFIDNDNDGYTNGTGSVCYGNTAPQGYKFTSLGEDCQDNVGTIFPGALEICFNGVDEDCDGLIDEDCTVPNNNGPGNAQPTSVSGNSFPNCGLISGSLAAAGDSPESVGFTGPDVWFRFTAQSTAVSITMNGLQHDNILVLYDNSFNQMPGNSVENAAGYGVSETLNYSGLTPGVQYLISAGAVTAPAGAYTICIRHLNASYCADGLNVNYQLCSNTKAQFTGASTYTYNFTPTGATGGVPTSITGSGQVPLSSAIAALRYGGTYTLTVDVTYNNLTYANGLPDAPITVTGVIVSNITILNHDVMFTKTTQNCPSTLLRGSILGGKPFICGATGFTVEFTQVTTCAGTVTNGVPFEVSTTGASSNLYLNFTSPQILQAQSFYRVRWRPNFSYGSGAYGTPSVIFIGGAVMETMNDLNAALNDAQKSDVSFMDANLYPNPNNGDMVNLNITDVKSDNVFVRIMDSMGRVVYTNRFSVDGSLNTLVKFSKPLAAGLYMVEFTMDGEVITERMMVTR